MVATLPAQISAMAERYPAFRPLQKENSCIWSGKVTPLLKTYDLTIAYKVPQVPGIFEVRRAQPRVQVRAPVLEPHPEFEEGPIPHVYGYPLDPQYPVLCLFDPYAGEWSIDDLIAETTIPWAERWLVNYEYWLATGKWEGGGRHFTAADEDGTDKELEEDENKMARARRKRANAGALMSSTAVDLSGSAKGRLV
jgi:hypothetical protein